MRFVIMENGKMDDLISRQAVILAMMNASTPAFDENGKPTFLVNYVKVMQDLQSADAEIPTQSNTSNVLNALEVVRCKDCTHYFTNDLEKAKNHGAECTMMNRRTMPEDYCSYGQKM